MFLKLSFIVTHSRCVSLLTSAFFSNSRIVLCFVALLFSSMQCVEGVLVPLKDFDNRFSTVFKRPITSKIKIKSRRN